MKLSPLRKQVQCLNKELQCQNIQIKDLINFLSKSSPKENLIKPKSPRSDLKRVLRTKDYFQGSKMYKGMAQKKITNNQDINSKSRKYLRPFYLIKHKNQDSSKNITSRQTQLVKSVTFHNIQNALTTRKYLKLSNPDKKINASCSFCREPTIGLHTVDSQRTNTISLKNQQQKNLLKINKLGDETKLAKNLSKKSIHSKSKTKIKQKSNSDKKNIFKQLNSNQILSKNQVKLFIEKKSLASCTNVIKNKVKLQLKDQKQNKAKLLTKI